MDKFYKHMFAVLGLVLLLLLLWFWRGALLSAAGLLLTAVTVAYLIHPLSELLERRVKRGIAALIVILLVLIVIITVVAVGLPAFARQVKSITDALPKFLTSMWAWVSSTEQWINEEFGLEVQFVQLYGDSSRINSYITSFIASIAGMAKPLGSAVTQVFLLPVLVFYLLRDREVIFDRLSHLVPSRYRPAATRAAAGVRKVLAVYVRGQILVSLITGALTGIGLAIVGLEGYLVLGAVMALFNLIPMFGPFIGAIPAIVVAVPHGSTTLLITILVLLLVQQIESAVITPRIIGEGSHLHPIVIIVALAVGGRVAGIMGMLFAVPLVLAIRSVFEAVREIRIYGERGGSSARMHSLVRVPIRPVHRTRPIQPEDAEPPSPRSAKKASPKKM